MEVVEVDGWSWRWQATPLAAVDDFVGLEGQCNGQQSRLNTEALQMS